MNMLAIIMLLAGAGFVVVEIFIPGFGVCGIIGLILIAVSAVLTIMASPFGVLIVGIELFLVFLVIYILFSYVKSKKQIYGKIILDETLNVVEKEIGDLDYFLGKEGTAKTSLRPYGMVDFNGISMEVYSDGGYIAENKRVKVVEIRDNKILVRSVNAN